MQQKETGVDPGNDKLNSLNFLLKTTARLFYSRQQQVIVDALVQYGGCLLEDELVFLLKVTGGSGSAKSSAKNPGSKSSKPLSGRKEVRRLIYAGGLVADGLISVGVVFMSTNINNSQTSQDPKNANFDNTGAGKKNASDVKNSKSAPLYQRRKVVYFLDYKTIYDSVKYKLWKLQKFLIDLAQKEHNQWSISSGSDDHGFISSIHQIGGFDAAQFTKQNRDKLLMQQVNGGSLGVNSNAEYICPRCKSQFSQLEALKLTHGPEMLFVCPYQHYAEDKPGNVTAKDWDQPGINGENGIFHLVPIRDYLKDARSAANASEDSEEPSDSGETPISRFLTYARPVIELLKVLDGIKIPPTEPVEQLVRKRRSFGQFSEKLGAVVSSVPDINSREIGHRRVDDRLSRQKISQGISSNQEESRSNIQVDIQTSTTSQQLPQILDKSSEAKTIPNLPTWLRESTVINKDEKNTQETKGLKRDRDTMELQDKKVVSLKEEISQNIESPSISRSTTPTDIVIPGMEGEEAEPDENINEYYAEYYQQYLDQDKQLSADNVNNKAENVDMTEAEEEEEEFFEVV